MYTQLDPPFFGDVDGLPAMAFGVLDASLAIIDMDGRMKLIPFEKFRVDIRWDERSRQWKDLSGPPED